MMEEYNINQTTLKILGLYRSDYRRSLHLRQIARVQLQLERLPRTNILSSVRKGRNKEYSVNLKNSIAKYYLMLAETFACITYLTGNFSLKKITSQIGDSLEGTTILFGTFEGGKLHCLIGIRMYARKSIRQYRHTLTEREGKPPFKPQLSRQGDLHGRRPQGANSQSVEHVRD
jgi:hypothetical protein